MPLLMLLALDHDNHGTEGDVKSAITSTLPQETVGLYRNRDSITKDGHAPFFMLLFLDHGDHGTQSGVNTAATFKLPRGMVWLRRDQNSIKKG